MRIALNATTEVGRRAGLILLAERDLIALGRYGESAPATDRRTVNISTLHGYDLLVTDDPTPDAIARIAAEDGLSCVAPGDVSDEVAARFAAAGRSVMSGVGIRAIAATLATHEAAHVTGEPQVVAAWTVPGKAIRKGVAVGFPEPVGARWGTRVDGGIAVPLAGAWAGAAATIRSEVDGRTMERVVGVADLREHLEAIALAAAAIVMAQHTGSTGRVRPVEVAEPFLAAALRCGMGVAAYTA